jgi:tetratricopeptide (TPR) repeat protein
MQPPTTIQTPFGKLRWCLLLSGVCQLGCWGAASQQQETQRIIQEEATHQELLRKGEASASLGDLTRAEQYYMAALKAGGAAKPITERLLVVCVADSRYPAALEYANQYLSRHPRDMDVTFAAASIHAALGDTLSARWLLEEVVKERPEWSDAHYALATVLRDQGESLDRADIHDLAYLRLQPDGPMAEQVRERLRRRTP